jgi:hypothetical protein
MKITIIVENPSANFFSALAGMGKPAALVTKPDTPEQPTPEQNDSAPEQPTPEQLASSARDVEVGDRVHWRGAKFEFDGVVESINSNATGAEKAIFVRRSDTNKLVSLTTDDLVDYDLTLLP